MTKEQIDTVNHMRLTDDEIDAVRDIALDAVDKRPFTIAQVALNAYKYGVMQGKRAERARRKKAAIGAGTPTAASDTMQNGTCVNGNYTTGADTMEGANE